MEKKIGKQVTDEIKVAKKTSKKSVKKSEKVSIKKQYLKSGSVCKVTFRLPKEAAPEAQNVKIVGDFNNWDKEATSMKRLKKGGFTVTLELQPGKEYKFRYLIDGNRWENDWGADRYERNPYGEDNSVVVV